MRKILNPFVFDRKIKYIKKMITEINRRQKTVEDCVEKCNLKETIGGLRDIEAIALLIKTFLNSSESITLEFFIDKKDSLPEIAEDLQVLYSATYFLRTVRNLYRLTEAAEDEIYKEFLDQVNTIIKISNLKENLSDDLYHDIRQTLVSSAKAIRQIITYFEDQLN